MSRSWLTVQFAIGLIGVVLGSVLGAGFAYNLERLRVTAAARGGLRLLSEDLRDARATLVELADEDAPADEADDALEAMNELWLTYRDRLATGLAAGDWQVLSFQIRHLHGLPGASVASASSERISTVEDATSQVAVLLERLEQRWLRRLLETTFRRVSAATSRPEKPAEPMRPVTLPELLAARALWMNAANAERDAAEATYGEILGAYQKQEGEIVSVFWAPKSRAAVALTRRPLSGWRALFEGGSETSFHLSPDWTKPLHPQVAELFHRVEVAAIIAAETTVEPERGLVLSALLQIAARILDFPDADKSHDEDARATFTAATRRELAEVEAFARAASGRAARRAYRLGTVLGVATVAVVTGSVAIVGAASGNNGLVIGAATAAAGAVAATVSALLRASGQLEWSVEPGTRFLGLLGAIRPAIGAILGLAVVFLSQAFLPLPAAVLVALAFLAGFIERFVRTTVVTTVELAPSQTERT